VLNLGFELWWVGSVSALLTIQLQVGSTTSSLTSSVDLCPPFHLCVKMSTCVLVIALCALVSVLHRGWVGKNLWANYYRFPEFISLGFFEPYMTWWCYEAQSLWCKARGGLLESLQSNCGDCPRLYWFDEHTRRFSTGLWHLKLNKRVMKLWWAIVTLG
jgi:hypothetical protein